MRSFLVILVGLLCLLVLTWFCAYHHRPMIEADLAEKTQQVLGALGLAEARAEPEGQIITLRGQVPNEQARRDAGAKASVIFGVEEVRNLLTVRPPPPPPIAKLPPPTAPVMTVEERKAAVNCQEVFSRLLLEPIQYAPGLATIDPSSHGLLDRLAEAAKTCPAASIEIGGHTDPRGTHSYNQKLSQDRAESVLRYLVGKNIDGKRLSAAGYGDSKPVADNRTLDGMRKNRRTEFVVKGL